MNKRGILFVTVVLAFFCTSQELWAQVAPQGGCVKDALQQIVCPPPNGGIAKDPLGQLVCGPGQCVRDPLGQIVCSSQPGGYAGINALGQAACTGGCERATASLCQRPM